MTSAEVAIHQPAGIAQLAAALAKTQAELPKLERDRTVTVQPKDPKKEAYSYSYATLANLSETILPLLAKHGLSFAVLPGIGSDGKMCIRYQLMHESGETLSGEFPISGEGGIQMIGGRITYARRYVLAAIAGVAADEDDEAHLSEDGKPRTAQRAAQQQRPQTAPPWADGTATAQRAPQRPRAGLPPLPGEELPALGGGKTATTPPRSADPGRGNGGHSPAAAAPVTGNGEAAAGQAGTAQKAGAPAPPPRIGAIQGHFKRLGYTGDDRLARLAATSQIIGRDIDTLNDLTDGEAVTVADTLARCKTRDRLNALLDGGGS